MTLLTILLLTVITFSSRYLFLHPGLPLKIGPKLANFLQFSAPAVLTTIWVPIIFVKESAADQGAQLDISLTNPYLLAATVAIIIAKQTKSIYLTLAASLIVFVLFKLYLP